MAIILLTVQKAHEHWIADAHGGSQARLKQVLAQSLGSVALEAWLMPGAATKRASSGS
ncbi:MAG: hypothetical protein NTY67_13585 [Cyanobacteria bacterium]|nr:hypothetical protein [Cyanobacteriota bacterium]